MSNPLMKDSQTQMMQHGQQAPQMTIQQAAAQLKSNTAEMLKQSGVSVPESMMSDPNAMIQHLIQSGQRPQNRLTQIMQMFGRR